VRLAAKRLARSEASNSSWRVIMAEIVRAVGGAGTGKTRYILDQLTEARESMGLAAEEVGMATFTRAGRAEISERAAESWGVPVEALTQGGWFRTAHSIGYRCCGVSQDQILAGKDGDEWLGHALGAKVLTKADARGEKTVLSVDGSDTITIAMRAWDLARSRMATLSDTLEDMRLTGENVGEIEEVRSVVEKYESKKYREGKLDFTDLIARFAGVRFTTGGIERVEPQGDVPECLKVLAIDEAQDSSRLVDAVCRRLAASDTIAKIWICGDPYQSIHGFAGGDYRWFMSWDAREYVMPRSYRCPRNILSLGERCLREMSRGYRDRGIEPISEGGSVGSHDSVASAIQSAGSFVRDGESTLILGRCAFSLEEYESELLGRKMPYCWVDKGHAPVALSGHAALYALERGRVCAGSDLKNAISMIRVSRQGVGRLLRQGAKAAWGRGEYASLDVVRPCDEDYQIAGIEKPLADLIASGRWPEALEGRNRERAEIWRCTAEQYGEVAASNPPIRLSTVHAAKGLEADNVILSTVSSPAVCNSSLASSDRRDEEWRIAYVAVTRAKKRFSTVNDGRKYRMEIPA
jgi:superfamily I DNA/RNA helicase